MKILPLNLNHRNFKSFAQNIKKTDEPIMHKKRIHQKESIRNEVKKYQSQGLYPLYEVEDKIGQFKEDWFNEDCFNTILIQIQTPDAKERITFLDVNDKLNAKNLKKLEDLKANLKSRSDIVKSYAFSHLEISNLINLGFLKQTVLTGKDGSEIQIPLIDVSLESNRLALDKLMTKRSPVNEKIVLLDGAKVYASSNALSNVAILANPSFAS